MRLRKFKLRKIVLGVRMHFRYIFPGQDKAVPSFGEAVEEWKPPDKIYTIDNTINTMLRYMLGFFFFLFFFLYSLLPPLFLSSLIRVLFSLFSFLLFLYYFFFFSNLFSLFSSFLIIIKLKNALHILIQLIQCTCVHQATEVNATNQTVQ